MHHGSFAGLATVAVALTQLLGAPLHAEEADDLGETLQPVDAYVYHCHDGDTCRLRVAGGMWLNVRLAGIDAPEVGGKRKKSGGQPMGAEARDFLNAKLKGKAVKVRQVDLDQYNRPVVELTTAPLDAKDAGMVVNTEMVAQGYAEMYRGKGKRWDKAAYEAAEADAKKAKRGIWGVAGYQSPAEFRKAKR